VVEPGEGDLVRSLNGLTRNRGATMNVDLPSSPQSVRGDRSRLQQALVNLIINARDAMPQGGTLSVDLVDDGTRASLVVRDTGVGIPPENLKRVFDRFFTTKSEQNGTGLGLSLVRAVVQEHDGELDVESEVRRGGISAYLSEESFKRSATLSRDFSEK
jgi:signal transduction histidine kinase